MILLALASHAVSQTRTLVLRPGPADGKGAELTTYAPSSNFGTSHWFDANAWTVGGEAVLIRSLIEFDLSGIPPDADIISATLSLYCNPNSTHYQLNAGDNQSLLLRVTESWDDNLVTWETQPGVSMDDPVFIATSTSNTQNYPDIDVTAHVRDMVSDPAHNHGWEIRLITEELYRSMQMSSCHDEEQYRPKLTVEYSTCDPPVAAWDYFVEDASIRFADSSSPSVFAWYWDFGDGYFSSLQNPVHQYGSYGNYPVCLKSTDSCGTAVFCDTVRYCLPLNTSFASAVNNTAVAFTGLPANAVQWFWSFGDGFYSDLQNPLHVYNSAGNYFVCLTARDNCSSETFCDSVSVIPNGIHDIPGNDFLVYPVPARDKLFLVTHNPLPKEVHAVVMNLQGSVLVEKEISMSLPDMRTEIDLAGFATGTYILKIILDNKVVVRKFNIIN